MNNTVIHASETAVQRAKRRMLVFALSIPVFFAVLLLINPSNREPPGFVFGAAVIFLVVFGAILIIESSILFRKMREMTLTISPEGMERSGGRFSEKISFSEINKVTITEYPSGQVASIKVELRGGKPIILQSFDKLDWVAQQFEEAIADKSMVQRKRLSVDWSNPWLMVAVALLTFLIILLLHRLGRNAYQLIYGLSLAVYGIYSLVYRPISRSHGKRFEKFEIILGIFVISSGIIIGIGLLTSYLLPIA